MGFIFESAYGALKVMDGTGAVPILIREKKGVKEYDFVIFVKKDSSLMKKDLAALDVLRAMQTPKEGRGSNMNGQ